MGDRRGKSVYEKAAMYQMFYGNVATPGYRSDECVSIKSDEDLHAHINRNHAMAVTLAIAKMVREHLPCPTPLYILGYLSSQMQEPIKI